MSKTLEERLEEIQKVFDAVDNKGLSPDAAISQLRASFQRFDDKGATSQPRKIAQCQRIFDSLEKGDISPKDAIQRLKKMLSFPDRINVISPDSPLSATLKSKRR